MSLPLPKLGMCEETKEAVKEMNTLRDYFAAYNQKIFPLQILMAVVATLLVGLVLILPGATTTLLLKAFLSVTFGWIGMAFLFLMGDVRKRWPFVSFATAVAYFPLAVIFILDMFSKTAYEIPFPGWRLYASLFVMAWGIILYPVTGYLLGHHCPRIPLFGAMPCPTNIFALGLLTAFASTRLEMIALYIVSSMAVIGGVKAAFIGYGGQRIREDIALLSSGIFGFVIGLVVL
jgi:hypothetical protein